MSETNPDTDEIKRTKRKGNKGRYKTVSGILKSITGFSHIGHKSKGEIVKTRSLEKISAYSQDEPDSKEGPNNPGQPISKSSIAAIKQKELIRRHSEFSIATSSRPRQATITVKEIDENKRRISYNRAKKKLNELLETEDRYVEKELKIIVEDYYGYIDDLRSVMDPALPLEFLKGEDMLIFANIKEIYEFHKRTFLPELRNAVDDPITLKSLFESRQDTFKYKYGRFCVNKPQSFEKMIEHQAFFNSICHKKSLGRGLNDLMTTPVRRIQMYSLLLKDIEKLMEKAGQFEKAKHIHAAFEIATKMANYVNDMMIVGAIDGFDGDVNKHGLLERRGIVNCASKDSETQKNLKYKRCHVFLFQESIVICTEVEKKQDGNHQTENALKYWTHYPMNKLLINEVSGENNTFVLKNANFDPLSREEESDDGFDEIDGPSYFLDGINKEEEDKEENKPTIVFKCEDEDSRNAWYRELNVQKSYLSNFADALSNPVM